MNIHFSDSGINLGDVADALMCHPDLPVPYPKTEALIFLGTGSIITQELSESKTKYSQYN